jgi:hypothetical protein
MADFRPEDIDLAEVAASLQDQFRNQLPVGYIPGKTKIRDAVMSKLGCSALEAERIVDTMSMRGFLRYGGTPSGALDGPLPWLIETKPSASRRRFDRVRRERTKVPRETLEHHRCWIRRIRTSVTTDQAWHPRVHQQKMAVPLACNGCALRVFRSSSSACSGPCSYMLRWSGSQQAWWALAFSFF